MAIDIDSLGLALEGRLSKGLVSSKVLLGKARLIDEASRLTSAYTDPHYLPFYYYLGSMIEPSNVVEFGFGLGLLGSCLVQGCKTIRKYLAVQEPKKGEFYSPRMARANVLDHYKGELIVHAELITEDKFLNSFNACRWDLAVISDEVGYDRHMAYLDALWAGMAVDGLIVADNLTRHAPANQAFLDFVKVRNRKPVLLNTRYGVGIIQR